MDSILQLTVYLTKIDDYDGMHKVFKTYFPNGGPARTMPRAARASTLSALCGVRRSQRSM